MKKCVIFLFLLIILFLETQKKIVAILEFDALGTSKQEALIIASLPDGIRGYEDIKMNSIRETKQKTNEKLKNYLSNESIIHQSIHEKESVLAN